MDKTLIAAVLKREPLWNPANDLHKNAVVLKKLWEEVAFELRRDMKTVKGRWKNLRAYFFKEDQKNEKLKSEGANKINSTWQYYNELMFLKGSTMNSGKDSNLNAVCDYMKTETMFGEEQNSVHSSSCSETISNHSHGLIDSLASPSLSLPKRKKSLANQSLSIDEDHFQTGNRKHEIADKNDKERNSDSLFFDSLLPYMANISLARKLRLRSKIQDLILTEIETQESSQ